MHCLAYLKRCFGFRRYGEVPLRRAPDAHWSSREVGCEEDDPDGEAYDKPYQAAQAHLSNLMTVSTLLLGFIITGTLLSAGLTGEENYTSTDLYNFVLFSALATIVATASMVLAVVVSVRASTSYSNMSAREGFIVIRYQQFWIFIAEFLLYLSFIFFIVSLRKYMEMQYAGPDICYYKAHVWRESSQCALVGADLYAGAEKLCTSSRRLPAVGGGFGMHPLPQTVVATGLPQQVFASGAPQQAGPVTSSRPQPSQTATSTAMPAGSSHSCPPGETWCSETGEGPKDAEEQKSETLSAVCVLYHSINEYSSDYQNLYGYSIAFFPENETSSPSQVDKFRMTAVLGAAEAMCDFNEISDARDEVCAQGIDNPLCAKLHTAYQKADECVNGAWEDADQCYKVCSEHQVGETSPAQKLAALVRAGYITAMVSTILVSLIRTVNAFCQLVESCKQDLENDDRFDEDEDDFELESNRGSS